MIRGVALLGVLSLALPAAAQTQVKARVMVIVDTSGSMVWHFGNNNTCGGDGNFQSRYSDVNVMNQNFYPGTIINGVPDGINSRIFAAKQAFFDVLNSTGNIDFGLMRFSPDGGCPNNVNCCNFNTPQCRTNGDYINNGGRLTWAGGCGVANNGGQILVNPTQANPNLASLAWVNNREDFRAGGLNGLPLDGELRANGPTPISRAMASARLNWYTPIYNFTRANPNCSPLNNPLCDPQIDCRPYAVVLMTDGADTCDGINSPPPTATALYNVNNVNPVLTYVIGVAFQMNDPSVPVLNSTAANGGTQSARFANNQASIEAAFADIAAASVKFEVCNRLDDTCDGFIDEGLGVYQECKMANQCASGVCNAGRCTCANNGQCQNGFACAGGLCVPSCATGQGICLRNGVRKCGNMGVECCVNDGLPACTPLAAGPPGNEVCNGLDDNCNGLIDENGVCQMCQPTAEVCDGKDNDCDGVIDNPNGLVDVNRPCGLNLGICKPGTTVCVNGMNQDVRMGGATGPQDHLICQGGVGPQMEMCNNLDDDCDGVVDGMTRTCYGGPMGTENVGICVGGQQKCLVGMFGQCVGEVLPQMEICDGLDNDCNGMIDDVMGAGQPCCPSGKCGVGICTPGTMQCSGGLLQCLGGQGPQGEVCNGVDDDCNGKVDDLPGLGNKCVPQNGCDGMLECDVMQMMVICKPSGIKNPEVCNGIDDNCNGKIDEEPDVSMNDPNVGQACGNPNNLPPPCMAGKTICKNGMIVCDGAVGPGIEVCDGLDNDCDGNLDNMAPCPMGFICYNGQCDPECTQGEFPCPGGYTPTTVNGICICVADKNCDPPCKMTETCDTQTGMCVDRCAKVMCPVGLKCDQGACYGCEHFGCADMCKRCDKASHQCVDDKCCNVKCDMGQFCDPGSGMCVGTCANGCPDGQLCIDGACVQDKCAGVKCTEAHLCDPKTGQCVEDGCANRTCAPNLACCNAACIADPCAAVTCPAGQQCNVDPLDCHVSCELKKIVPVEKDQIVGAGGGGFSCAATGARRNSNGSGALFMLAIFAGWMGRRTRPRGRSSS